MAFIAVCILILAYFTIFKHLNADAAKIFQRISRNA